MQRDRGRLAQVVKERFLVILSREIMHGSHHGPECVIPRQRGRARRYIFSSTRSNAPPAVIPVVRPKASRWLWWLCRTDDPPDRGVRTISDLVGMQFSSPPMPPQTPPKPQDLIPPRDPDEPPRCRAKSA